jgi:Capsule polysaccharide biosynthesis protein
MTYSNQFAIFDETNAEYERIQTQGLGEEERVEVRKYIADFRSNSLPPPYMGYMARKPGLRWGDLRVLATLGYWNSRDKMDYTLVSPARAISNRLTRIVRAQLYRPLWEQPVKHERYVLFPLHYQPEASTSVRAPFVLDQCALVENIAKALPAGYRLYVKEHTARLGNKPLRDLHRLRAIPAVRLIHPTANIRELVKGAACVATITSTTGWEALLNGVRVVVFGRVFYEKCSNVHLAGSPYEYPMTFRRALSSRPQPRATEDFVAALLRTSFPGAHGHPYYLPQVLDPENIKSVANHLAAKLTTGITVR